MKNHEQEKDTNKKANKRVGKFELYEDEGRQWRFRLKAANGEIIAVSEGYSSKEGARSGIDSVRKNALTTKIVEV